MENSLNESASKDVPHRQAKGIVAKFIRARAFLNEMHYDVHADLGRAIGVVDSHRRSMTASVRPAGLL